MITKKINNLLSKTKSLDIKKKSWLNSNYTNASSVDFLFVKHVACLKHDISILHCTCNMHRTTDCPMKKAVYTRIARGIWKKTIALLSLLWQISLLKSSVLFGALLWKLGAHTRTGPAVNTACWFCFFQCRSSLNPLATVMKILALSCGISQEGLLPAPCVSDWVELSWV